MTWLWWLQFGADLLLIGAVIVLLGRLRSGGGASLAAPKEMQEFLAEGQRLSREFDRILGEKRELVGTTISTLDNRLAQMREMVDDLEKRLAEARKLARSLEAPAPDAGADKGGTAGKTKAEDKALEEFRRKVLALARQGKAPAQIAEATGRPRGEVELVLGLSGRS